MLTCVVKPVGNITRLSVIDDPTSGKNTYIFSLRSGGMVEVTPWASDVVRVRFHFTELFSKEEPMIARRFSDWAAVTTQISDRGAYYLIQTPQLNVFVNKRPFKVDFQDLNGYFLLRDDHLEYTPSYQMHDDTKWLDGCAKLKCTKQMPADQAYFGFGEYAGPSNRRGRNVICWNTPTYRWGDGQNPMYMNMPFFYGVQPAGNRNPAFVYGIFFNNPCRAVFRMGTQSPDTYSFEAGDGQMDYFFFGGGVHHTMKLVLDRFSELTGRPSMLPKWAMGHHLSRFSYNNQEWVEYIVRSATENNIPLDAVYLDVEYMDATGQNNINSGQIYQLMMNSNYPNPQAMVAACVEFGVKVIPAIEPWLARNDPLRATEDDALDYIKDNSGNETDSKIYLGSVSWLDYTSSRTLDRWQALQAEWFRRVAFAGIWNDLTEPEDHGQIPLNGLLWLDGRYGTSIADTRRHWSNERNYFGLRSASSSYNTLLAAYPEKRPFVLTRSGCPGIQRYAVGWSGDTVANWYYIQACIRLGVNTMISGQSRFGHDLGGFSDSVSGELLTRWYEWGALLPLFRNHAQNGGNMWADGSQGREPWRFTPHQNFPQADGIDYCGLIRSIIQFRYKLMPYLYTLMQDSTVNGTPLNTPTFFNYYNDRNTFTENEFDFMCGDYLLVAPVYTQGASTRTVYLPAMSNWYHWATNRKYCGGQVVTVDAPLGILPLFMRADAIIPMGPSMQFANQLTPLTLDMHCWPETESSFTLYEDEGDGWDFINGFFARTTFTSLCTPNGWDFGISARKGKYNTGPRTLRICVHNPRNVKGVQHNGLPLTQLPNPLSLAIGWILTKDGRLEIRVPETGADQFIHVDWSEDKSEHHPSSAENYAADQYRSW